ncbi:MAG: 6,7-dimethyl-8-ribityllumazine synthase [Candidatus Diapherotrites archaeon]|nr:6,7-dimethyl-8-ribityllumazine synthase [Candidatus Diapherotrites archaeon]
MRMAFVVSRFNEELTLPALKAAQKECRKIGLSPQSVMYVPGVFDSPLAVQRLLSSRLVEGVVVIAAVVKGKTTHDEVIVHATARALQDLSLKFNKPVGFAVCGPNCTYAQAKARMNEYAKRGVQAVYMLKK